MKIICDNKKFIKLIHDPKIKRQQALKRTLLKCGGTLTIYSLD